VTALGLLRVGGRLWRVHAATLTADVSPSNRGHALGLGVLVGGHAVRNLIAHMLRLFIANPRSAIDRLRLTPFFRQHRCQITLTFI